MQDRKARAIGVDGEHRAIARTAAIRPSHTGCCPIKSIRQPDQLRRCWYPLVIRAAVKLCRFVKPVPSVLTANTVPLPELPPTAVPYRVLPDKINPACGWAPSLFV